MCEEYVQSLYLKYVERQPWVPHDCRLRQIQSLHGEQRTRCDWTLSSRAKAQGVDSGETCLLPGLEILPLEDGHRAGVEIQRQESMEFQRQFWMDHWGVERACAAITGAGFAIVEPDVEVSQRDPVTSSTSESHDQSSDDGVAFG